MGKGVYLFECVERGMLIKNHIFGMPLLLFTRVCLLGSSEYWTNPSRPLKIDAPTGPNFDGGVPLVNANPPPPSLRETKEPDKPHV